MIFFFLGVLPVNIDNLLIELPGTTKLGIGISMATYLLTTSISLLIFGYFEDKITEKNIRKKIFITTNLLWIISYGIISISINYYFYLFFIIFAAIGTGAFVPIGYSIVGDLYSPKERGKKYGGLHLSLTLGTGLGIILGGLLGRFIVPNGWRFAYGIGSILGVLVLMNYYFIGIDPERGRSEPEFENFEGAIKYDYKLTLSNLSQIFKKKTIVAILLYILFSGIATSTLGIWGIYYLNFKIGGPDPGISATALYIFTGIGILPGAVVGGKIGDSFYKSGKIRGRVIISFLGLIAGIILLLLFFLLPFASDNAIEIILSWTLLLVLGFTAYFLVSLSAGNIFAIYSEVCTPELRSRVNAFNGIMVNIGGIIGNLLLSSMIERDLSLLPLSITIILLFWLCGSFFWLLAYIYYPKESKQCREILAERRKDLEKKRFK
ncbi:MAG: MFS transporter [Candidatus Hermodarchaeota archaeon]